MAERKPSLQELARKRYQRRSAASRAQQGSASSSVDSSPSQQGSASSSVHSSPSQQPSSAFHLPQSQYGQQLSATASYTQQSSDKNGNGTQTTRQKSRSDGSKLFDTHLTSVLGELQVEDKRAKPPKRRQRGAAVFHNNFDDTIPSGCATAGASGSAASISADAAANGAIPRRPLAPLAGADPSSTDSHEDIVDNLTEEEVDRVRQNINGPLKDYYKADGVPTRIFNFSFPRSNPGCMENKVGSSSEDEVDDDDRKIVISGDDDNGMYQQLQLLSNSEGEGDPYMNKILMECLEDNNPLKILLKRRKLGNLTMNDFEEGQTCKSFDVLKKMTIKGRKLWKETHPYEEEEEQKKRQLQEGMGDRLESNFLQQMTCISQGGLRQGLGEESEQNSGLSGLQSMLGGGGRQLFAGMGQPPVLGDGEGQNNEGLNLNAGDSATNDLEGQHRQSLGAGENDISTSNNQNNDGLVSEENQHARLLFEEAGHKQLADQNFGQIGDGEAQTTLMDLMGKLGGRNGSNGNVQAFGQGGNDNGQQELMQFMGQLGEGNEQSAPDQLIRQGGGGNDQQALAQLFGQGEGGNDQQALAQLFGQGESGNDQQAFGQQFGQGGGQNAQQALGQLGQSLGQGGGGEVQQSLMQLMGQAAGGNQQQAMRQFMGLLGSVDGQQLMGLAGTGNGQQALTQLMGQAGAGNGQVLQRAMMLGQNNGEKELDPNNADISDIIHQMIGIESMKAEHDRSPRAAGMCTMIIMDTSASMEGSAFLQAMEFITEFINGLEEIQFEYNLNENVALVTVGAQTQVLQHLTNDYSLIKQAAAGMLAEGPSPLHMALMLPVVGFSQVRLHNHAVTGVYTYHGHIIQPRVIVISDGHLSKDLAQERAPAGSQEQMMLQNTCFTMLDTAVTHTMCQLFCVPVGSAANRDFLDALGTYTGRGGLMSCRDARQMSRYFLRHTLAADLRNDGVNVGDCTAVTQRVKAAVACSDDRDVAKVQEIINTPEPNLAEADERIMSKVNENQGGAEKQPQATATAMNNQLPGQPKMKQVQANIHLRPGAGRPGSNIPPQRLPTRQQEAMQEPRRHPMSLFGGRGGGRDRMMMWRLQQPATGSQGQPGLRGLEDFLRQPQNPNPNQRGGIALPEIEMGQRGDDLLRFRPGYQDNNPRPDVPGGEDQ